MADSATVDPAAPEEKAATWRINPFFFFGFIGMSLYASWIFLQYLNPLLLARGSGLTPTWLDPHLFLIVFAAVALGLFWLFTNALSTVVGKRVLLFCAIVFGPLSSLTPYLSDFGIPQLVPLFWALSGIAYAGLLMLWGTLLTALKEWRIWVFTASAIIVGAALYVFALSLVDSITFLFSAALPIASALCFFLSHRTRPADYLDSFSSGAISAADSDEKDPITWRVVADTLTYTPCLGIAAFYALHHLTYPQVIICVGLASMLSCGILIADALFWHFFTSKTQLKFFLPLTAVAVFPLSFVSGTLIPVFVFLIFMVFMLSLATNYAAISECVRIFELSPIRVFAYGRAFNILGVLFGYIFALLTYRDNQPDITTILAFCVLIFVFIIAATFILEDHYPLSSDVADELEAEIVHNTNSRDSWDERCTRAARMFELSPRQTEVLALLAKGRNTGYIQEHLVISHYTAKAHIYNIYQKIGIHSRQELLTLIEQIDLDA